MLWDLVFLFGCQLLLSPDGNDVCQPAASRGQADNGCGGWKAAGRAKVRAAGGDAAALTFLADR